MIEVHYSCAHIRFYSPFPMGMTIWNGNHWAYWEEGSDEEKVRLAKLIRADRFWICTPDWAKRIFEAALAD